MNLERRVFSTDFTSTYLCTVNKKVISGREKKQKKQRHAWSEKPVALPSVAMPTLSVQRWLATELRGHGSLCAINKTKSISDWHIIRCPWIIQYLQSYWFADGSTCWGAYGPREPDCKLKASRTPPLHICKNLSVISVESSEKECACSVLWGWFGTPAVPKERLHPF